MICSSPSGMFGFSSCGGFGSSLICFKAMLTGFSPSNGSLPVIISYIITPTE